MEFVINLILAVVAIGLGGYILLFGRKVLWATLGIMALAATANLLAVLVVGADFGWQLIDFKEWGLVVITIAVGALGFVLGRFKPEIAVGVIGFIAGADIALWFYEISSHFVIEVARLSEQISLGIGLLLLLMGGLIGLWLARKYRDEILIIVTMLVGVQLIHDGFRFDSTSSVTAILMIILALVGILVQYAGYLRELEAKTPLLSGETTVSSVAYFQDLELDE